VKLARKQSHAGKKIPGQCAVRICRDALDQRIDKPAIHLKKRALIHAIIHSGSPIQQRTCAPLRHAVRGLALRAFGQEFHARQLGNFSGKGLRKVFKAPFSGPCNRHTHEQRSLRGIAKERNLAHAQPGR
jgi:hypothetical protein